MEIVHDKYGNCLETIYLTLIRHYGFSCPQIIYSFSWDFGYESPKCQEPLESRLRNAKNIFVQEELLEKYFGLHIAWYENKIDAVNKMKDSNPFVICIDSFWYPWNPAFQIDHIPHYFIGTHCDSDKIICLDPYFNLVHQVLPLEYIDKGCIKCGFVVRKNFVQYAFFDVFHQSIKNVVFGDDGASDADKIRRLAGEIKSNKHFIDELLHGQKSLHNSKVLLAFTHIARGRMKYANHWMQYAGTDHSGFIKHVALELLEVYEQWNVLGNFLIKCCIDEYTEKHAEYLYSSLMAIADNEERIGEYALNKLSQL